MCSLFFSPFCVAHTGPLHFIGSYFFNIVCTCVFGVSMAEQEGIVGSFPSELLSVVHVFCPVVSSMCVVLIQLNACEWEVINGGYIYVCV